jgi:DNA mismatch endonuclease (patch repair protein)
MGYRYRLHAKGLPGHPDIVFPARLKVIFVHGCFWHLHRSCPECRPPKSKIEYWGPKLKGNAARDKQVRKSLRQLGWRCLVVWECELRDCDKISRRIAAFLNAA